MTDYVNPVINSNIAGEKISTFEPDQQIQAMESWFRKNYEDPAQSTPYSSSEGGYVYIWGGPFDAYDELYNHFSDDVDDVLIEKLAAKLSAESDEWAPAESKNNYESELIQDIANISQYCQNFSGAILDIEALLNVPIPTPQQEVFLRLIFANVITVLETYLSDAFINHVVGNPELLRKFVETTTEFKSEKITLSEIFKEHDGIYSKVEKHLANVIWHRLDIVSSMYKDTLSVAFPKDIGDIYKAIHKRHDIVHRNGKDKTGQEITITKEQIKALIQKTESLVTHIDSALAELAIEQ